MYLFIGNTHTQTLDKWLRAGEILRDLEVDGNVLSDILKLYTCQSCRKSGQGWGYSDGRGSMEFKVTPPVIPKMLSKIAKLRNVCCECEHL